MLYVEQSLACSDDYDYKVLMVTIQGIKHSKTKSKVNFTIPYIFVVLTQKRNAAQLTRLKKKLPEAQTRNQQRNEQATCLEESISQMKMQQDK